MEDLLVIAMLVFNLVLINFDVMEPNKFFGVLWLIAMVAIILRMAGVLNV